MRCARVVPTPCRRVRQAAAGVLILAVLLLGAGPARAQVGERIVEVVVEQDGQPVTDPVVLRLAGVLVGRPLAMAEVSETIRRLMSLNRFEDVRPHAEPAPDGVRIRYELVPRHPVDRVEFRGTLGLSEREIRRIVTDRFGERPGAARMHDVAEAVRVAYRSRGYPQARVEPSVEVQEAGRAALVLTVAAGPRARVSTVTVQQMDPDGVPVPAAPDVRVGQAYDAMAIDRQLDAYVDRLRRQQYYEARATHAVAFGPDGATAAVTLTLERGPRVEVDFGNDPLARDRERDRLVPIRAEGSADEDLLEDSARAIEEYLFGQGYRNASVDYVRDETPEALTIRFDIARGARHMVEAVRFEGHDEAAGNGELRDLLRLRAGEPFVQRTIDQGVAQMRAVYRAQGYIRAEVEAADVLLPPARPGGDRPVEVVVTVREGPQTRVRMLAFEGVEAFDADRLRGLLALRAGQPYSDVALRGDGNRLELEYLNDGYEEVVVTPDVRFAEDDTWADVRFVVEEGPQILVDQLIIVGNQRTGTATIERELLLRPGEPLGYAALIESRARLIALGLFRRVQIEPLAHGAGPRRDVLVQVEESPVYSLGFGGGLEGGFRLRTRPDGTSAERLELAPRGFFEIGRRNLWGKNRSINLFSRVSLRSRDVFGDPLEPPAVETSYGFNEYRVLLTYREPRVFGSAADVLVSGIFDQAVRTSFNFITREARAEAGWRLSRRYSLLGRYTVRNTELFDERFPEADKPLIDRVFPQVRTSKVAGSIIRDTRDDLLDPSTGTFLSVDGDVAARAIGSEVGFVKSYVQGFAFRRLPVERRTILALGARMGVAHGFPRPVVEVGEHGEPVTRIVQDLPANERFFAGGDTSVRGFSLDRLGSDETISPLTGFPTGGNAVLVLNAELRVALFGALQGVGFVDAGNVYAWPRSLSVLDLRPAMGFGLWYRWAMHVRLDLGFNPRRRELVPGQRERGYVLHLAIGPAF